MDELSEWMWLVPLVRPAATLSAVVVAGVVHRCRYRTWPTRSQWVAALGFRRPFPRTGGSGGQAAAQVTGGQGNGVRQD